MEQFIPVGNITAVPSRAGWKGNSMAEVENGRVQYIQVGNIASVSAEATWRGNG